MAAVYEAHDPRLNRAVALKMLPPEFLHDSSFAARFQQEARVVALLDHSGIVPIFASGIDDGIPWMSMRLATGGSLAARLRNGRLAPLAAINILKQVAAAIDHAHSRGVTHRDIKPANILLDGEGTACVADFGLAHLLDRNPELTRTGVLLGTPHYMAPEQALGKVTGRACDIYSLGIVAYEMVVGRPPFEADSPVALLMKHVNEPLPDPLDPTIPATLLDVVRKAASKDPSKRWDSAGAFIAAFEAAWLHGIHGIPTGTRGGSRVSRVRLGLLAGALSCTLLVAIGLTWFDAQDPRVTTSRLVVAQGVSSTSRPPPAMPPNPPVAATTSLPIRPRVSRGRPVPEQTGELVAPPPLDVLAADPAITVDDAAEPKGAVEAAIRPEPPETIRAPDTVPSPQAEKFTAPVRLKTIAPIYPSVARAAQIEGDVVLVAYIDQYGRVTDVNVARSVHPLLDQAARQAGLRYEYAPGRRGNIPESSTVRITVSFKLQ
jgi:serine/threonine-protein kinase